MHLFGYRLRLLLQQLLDIALRVTELAALVLQLDLAQAGMRDQFGNRRNFALGLTLRRQLHLLLPQDFAHGHVQAQQVQLALYGLEIGGQLLCAGTRLGIALPRHPDLTAELREGTGQLGVAAGQLLQQRVLAKSAGDGHFGIGPGLLRRTLAQIARAPLHGLQASLQNRYIASRLVLVGLEQFQPHRLAEQLLVETGFLGPGPGELRLRQPQVGLALAAGFHVCGQYRQHGGLFQNPATEIGQAIANGERASRGIVNPVAGVDQAAATGLQFRTDHLERLLQFLQRGSSQIHLGTVATDLPLGQAQLDGPGLPWRIGAGVGEALPGVIVGLDFRQGGTDIVIFLDQCRARGVVLR